MTLGLAQYARRILTSAEPLEKVRLTQEAAETWARTRHIGPVPLPPSRPSRPQEPLIVGPGEMPTAKSSGFPSNIYHLHGLAHVELNAIDLCFDTMLRFAPGISSEIANVPLAADVDAEPCEGDAVWFTDWVSIAADEARHFSLLDARLRALGSRYGALPAHGIVWSAADASQTSRRERVAAGQLVAEARGLDAGPKLAERLVGAGDNASAAIVQTIADEEVRHVRIGVKWFVWECARVGLDPVKSFHEIAVRVANPGAFVRPFNEERRRMAGLTPEWYLPVALEIEERRARLRTEREANKKDKTIAPTTKS